MAVIQEAGSVKPKVPRATPPRLPIAQNKQALKNRSNYNAVRTSYNVQAVQGETPQDRIDRFIDTAFTKAWQSVFGGGGGIVALTLASQGHFDAVAKYEAAAQQQGLTAYYNAPFKGEAGISGWGNPSFGQIVGSRTGGSIDSISVAYLNEAERVAAQRMALAADTARGNPGNAGYVLTDPSKFKPFGTPPPKPSPPTFSGGNSLNWGSGLLLAKAPRTAANTPASVMSHLPEHYSPETQRLQSNRRSRFR